MGMRNNRIVRFLIGWSLAGIALVMLAKAEEIAHITDKQRAAYYKAIAEMRTAENALTKAQLAVRAAVEDMHRTCGASPVPKNGEPHCPEPAKEPVK